MNTYGYAWKCLDFSQWILCYLVGWHNGAHDTNATACAILVLIGVTIMKWAVADKAAVE